MVGRRFGQWKVLRKGKYRSGNYHWICKCSCGSVKDVSQNHLLKGKSTQCIKCSGKRNSESARIRNTSNKGKTLYGDQRSPWMVEARRKQRAKQKGICPVCLKKLPNDACFDHDHLTGECRELVHRGCNVFIGFAERYPDILSRVEAYLRRHGWRTNFK